MDAKAEAKQLREIADMFDKLSDRFQPLSIDTANEYRDNAKVNRQTADELDPPRIADPSKQEVVISIEGIDREGLDTWATENESNYGAPSQLITIRAAKAAREQLGEVQ